MWQFSYWLFPVLAAVFVASPTWRPLLMPGLLAACAAGAGNSTALSKYASCAGHGFAAAALLLWAPFDAPPIASVVAAVGWCLVAAGVTTTLPTDAWPYFLSPSQMLTLFVVFLPAGVVASVGGDALFAAVGEVS